METVRKRMILYVNVHVTFLGAWSVVGRSCGAEIVCIDGGAADGAARLRLLARNIPVQHSSVKPPHQMIVPPGYSASESEDRKAYLVGLGQVH